MKKFLVFSIFFSILWTSCHTPKTESGKITVVSYGGGSYHQSHVDAFISPYEMVTGVDVDALVWNAEYGKLKAMVDTKQVPWDVVEVTDAEFKRGKKEGLFEPLLQKPDSADFITGTIDSYGVANVYWTTVLAYNKNSYPGLKPKTWADFWNVRDFPGSRALYDDPRGNLEFALLADGVKKDKLYPLDFERAFKKLDQIKPYVKVWWKDGTQPVQLLNEGSVDISSAWNGRIFSLGKANKVIEFSWLGAVSELDWWIIPKGSKNTSAASRFITFASKAENMARQAEMIGYGPVNKKSFRYISNAIKKDLSTNDSNWKLSFVINSEWWQDNENEMMKKWIEWKTK